MLHNHLFMLLFKKTVLPVHHERLEPLVLICESLYAAEGKSRFPPSVLCCPVMEHEQQFQRKCGWLASHVLEEARVLAFTLLHWYCSWMTGESWLVGGNWKVTKITGKIPILNGRRVISVDVMHVIVVARVVWNHLRAISCAEIETEKRSQT